MSDIIKICNKYGVKPPPEIIGHIGEKSAGLYPASNDLESVIYEEEAKIYELNNTLINIQ